jgi:hypothetical protein
MARQLVGNTRGNGSVLLQPRAVYSKAPTIILPRIKLIWHRALTNGHESSDLRVYITGDGGDVYEESFMEVAKPDGKTFIPTLILVGTRLGVDKITPVYWEALKASLQMPQSMGIAG